MINLLLILKEKFGIRRGLARTVLSAIYAHDPETLIRAGLYYNPEHPDFDVGAARAGRADLFEYRRFKYGYLETPNVEIMCRVLERISHYKYYQINLQISALYHLVRRNTEIIGILIGHGLADCPAVDYFYYVNMPNQIAHQSSFIRGLTGGEPDADVINYSLGALVAGNLHAAHKFSFYDNLIDNYENFVAYHAPQFRERFMKIAYKRGNWRIVEYLADKLPWSNKYKYKYCSLTKMTVDKTSIWARLDREAIRADIVDSYPPEYFKYACKYGASKIIKSMIKTVPEKYRKYLIKYGHTKLYFKYFVSNNKLAIRYCRPDLIVNYENLEGVSDPAMMAVILEANPTAEFINLEVYELISSQINLERPK